MAGILRDNWQQVRERGNLFDDRFCCYNYGQCLVRRTLEKLYYVP
ncbi:MULTISPECIES: hypothetical protein [Okeania]|nr:MULTISPECIES: hypothetical protein [Okeania]